MSEKAPGEPPSRWNLINDYSKTMVALAGALLAFIAAFSDKLPPPQPWDIGRYALFGAIVMLVLTVGLALLVLGPLDKYLRICAAGEPGANAGATVTGGAITGGTVTSASIAGGTLASGVTTGATVTGTLVGVKITGAIVTGVTAPAGTASQAEWDNRANTIWWCKSWANWSYITLFIAGMLLATFAGIRLFTPSQPPPTPTPAPLLTSKIPTLNDNTALIDALNILQTFSGQPQAKWMTQSINFDEKSDSYTIVVTEQTLNEKFKVTMPRSGEPSNVERIQ